MIYNKPSPYGADVAIMQMYLQLDQDITYHNQVFHCSYNSNEITYMYTFLAGVVHSINPK